eukprot:7099423-Alexandrium_andersonii.AAC.1
MSASLVGSEMCIRDRFVRRECARSLELACACVAGELAPMRAASGACAPQSGLRRVSALSEW